MTRPGICRIIVVALVGGVIAVSSGCGGGGGDSGFTEDQIAQALNLHYGGNDLLFTYKPGTNCIVTDVLTSSGDVDQAQSSAGGLDTAIATNSEGTAGVVFGGYTGHSPDVCVPAAEQDLNSPSSGSNAATTSQQNQQVIQHAKQAADAQAALTEDQIRKKLDKELHLQNIGGTGKVDFRVPGGGACYVALGAEAVNFQYKKNHILRSPDGQSVVFVQSFTGTPLADCLVAVNQALGW